VLLRLIHIFLDNLAVEWKVTVCLDARIVGLILIKFRVSGPFFNFACFKFL